jgi:UDP-2,3-diacylglucosamine pyrophosphatase LpxH
MKTSHGPYQSAQEYLLVAFSDQHRLVFNAASDRQRAFLDTIRTRVAVAVGDTLDFERKALHSWHAMAEEDKRYIDSFVGLGARGTSLHVLEGNHDQQLDRLRGNKIHDISFAETYEFTTPQGQRGVMIHGHQFYPYPAMASLPFPRVLTAMGDHVHTGLVAASAYLDKAVEATLKTRFNAFAGYMNALETVLGNKRDFENKAVAWAEDHGYDVIITGHTHLPDMKKMKGPKTGREIIYINDGDGVENFTWVGLTAKGEWQLNTWHDYSREIGKTPQGLAEENREKYRHVTDHLIADVHARCLDIPRVLPAALPAYQPR